MEFEIDIDREEIENYSVLETVLNDDLCKAILLVLLKNRAFDQNHALPTPDIYRTIKIKIDRSAKYLQIWKRLYKLMEYGIVDRIEDNPVRWYVKGEYINKIIEKFSKIELPETKQMEFKQQ